MNQMEPKKTAQSTLTDKCAFDRAIEMDQSKKKSDEFYLHISIQPKYQKEVCMCWGNAKVNARFVQIIFWNWP